MGSFLDPAFTLSTGQAEFTLVPLGSETISPIAGLSLLTGSVVLTVRDPISAFIRFGITGAGIAGVRGSAPLVRSIIPVQGFGIRTGLAIRNVEVNTVFVALSLLDRERRDGSCG